MLLAGLKRQQLEKIKITPIRRDLPCKRPHLDFQGVIQTELSVH